MLRVVKFVAPDNENMKFKVFNLKEKPALHEELQFKATAEQSIAETFHTYREHDVICSEYFEPQTCVLQLFYNKGTHLSKITEVPCKHDSKLQISFSLEGKFLLLFSKRQKRI